MSLTPTVSLPWSVDVAEDRRFKLILAALGLAALILFIWVPLIDLPEREREELEELPPQLARILVEKQPVVIPEPPKPAVVEEPAPKEEAIPEPKPEPKPKPKPKIEPKPELKPKPVQPTQKQVEQAREVAKQSGLLALQSELSSMVQELDTNKLRSTDDRAPVSRKVEEQSVISRSSATQTSDGINTPAKVSTQNQSLAALDTTRLDETNAEQALAVAEAEAALGTRERSDDSLRLGLEPLRKSFNKLYTRAQRDDPFLEGNVEIEFAVEPNGAVSYCKIVMSELNHPELEAKFCARMKLTNFGTENVARTMRTVPFKFFP